MQFDSNVSSSAGGDSLAIGGHLQPIWNRLPCNRAMVLAILNRTKLQTRRGINLPKCLTWGKDFAGQIEVAAGKHRGSSFDVDELRTPYGRRGDCLWVTEAWRVPAAYDQVAPRDLPRAVNVRYEADGYQRIGTATREALSEPWGKLRPGMFMLRRASRISLEVQGVRAELLHDISEADAMAEGVVYDPGEGGTFHVPGLGGCAADSAAGAFRKLWEQINGTESWAANPWVWVVEFKKLENRDA
ncbi:hypothetical protein [Roseateles flavus]|uniref:ASCH domain-containing protein n=1 Tax=Roseateles flavus TaxID=3149041 RepID=A0ABV0GG50_9BURK